MTTAQSALLLPPDDATQPDVGLRRPGGLASDADAELVRALVTGSHGALATLYDRHSAAVYAAALRIGGDPALAEDVVQETFLALWNHAETFDATRGALVAWLLTIARNRAVDHHRSARRRDRAASFSSFTQPGIDDATTGEWLTAVGAPVAMGGAEPDPETVVATREAAASIHQAMAALEPNERRVIELAYHAGLSQPEIAERLGWPLGTVKTRTRRALRRLRETMERVDARRAPPLPRRATANPCAWLPCR